MRKLLISSEKNTDKPFVLKLKRIFWVVLGLFVSILTLPIMLLLAVLIKIDSPGPVIFKQTRVAMDRRKSNIDNRQNNHGSYDKLDRRKKERRQHENSCRTFTFYKFRTMKVDARELHPELYEYKYNQEEVKDFMFKMVDDPRLTRVGKWLRKTSLDELPNFINLIKGDVVLVGPRPEIPEMVPYYSKEQEKKFSVKPGLTGLAQVCGRGDLKFQETIQYDLEYISCKSFFYDVKIIFKTIISVIFRKGAF